ncbi:sodium:solute symporter family transporter [Rosistilla oblonga]|uniref:Sodium/pantothenate symporter n=1 Tax=Rosistilla oblonga TaxID=2527990 RepID=A0A518IRW8_9BACT|nr:hypothetical protein [Rosistilla oblonga]QDV55824.1 Sodium/pantothenate symporter [Rosistilla oblonga]
MNLDSFNLLAVTEAGTPIAALVTFILYSVAVVLLAVASQVVLQKRSFLQEYFLGSRNLGWIAFTLTFAATSASAGSFGGFPAKVYNHGWVLGLWIAGYMAVPLVSLGLLGKRLNRISKETGSITMPEMIGLRFPGHAVRGLATGMIVVLMSIYLVPQFKMAGVILQSLLHDFVFWQTAAGYMQQLTADIPILQADDPGYLLGLFVFSSMVIVYTSLGGFRAVVWTDVLQGIVMLFGVLGLLVLVLSQVGGLTKATQTLAKMQPPNLGMVEFSTDGSIDQPTRVAMDTWFEVGPDRLFRTNAAAYIDPETGRSAPIKTVEIMGEEEKQRIRRDLLSGAAPALPPGLTVELDEFHPYAYGAGKEGVYTTAPGPSARSEVGFLPLSLAFSFFLFWSIGGSGQPSNMIRQMSFDRVRTLKRSMIFLTFYFGAIYFPLVVIFVCGRVLVPGLDQDPDRIMAALSLTAATAADVPWLAGLLIAAPFAAAMSTVDSFMLMISSSLVRDIYQPMVKGDVSDRTVKMLSYGCTFSVGTIVMLVAISPPKFLQDLVVFTSGGLSSSFLVPVFLGVYWTRYNSIGAVCGMLTGFFTFLSMYGIGYLMYGSLRAYEPLSFDPMIVGVLGSGIGSLIGCLSSPPPPRSIVHMFFGAKSPGSPAKGDAAASETV